MTDKNLARIEPRPRIALLGTGKMGSAIGERLAKAGFELTLWNRTRSRAEALNLGPVGDTPAKAVRVADIVISSLTGPDAVRSAYLGTDGALGAGNGRLFIEMSTAGPEIVPVLAARSKPQEVAWSTPPSWGPRQSSATARRRSSSRGDRADVELVSPILEALGTVRHVGPLGSGARLKLVANSMLADVILAAAELQVAGEEAGLDGEDVFWVLERLAPALEARRRGYLEHRHEPALFAMRDLLKDLDLASALFDASGAATPLTALSRTLVADAAWETPDLDVSAVIRPYRNKASLRWTGSPPGSVASDRSREVGVP